MVAFRVLARTSLSNRRGWDYPLHLGVTEAGEGEDGRMKSAIGIGALLMDGLGDTIRVSLTEDPEYELKPCNELAEVRALGSQNESTLSALIICHCFVPGSSARMYGVRLQSVSRYLVMFSLTVESLCSGGMAAHTRGHDLACNIGHIASHSDSYHILTGNEVVNAAGKRFRLAHSYVVLGSTTLSSPPRLLPPIFVAA